MKERIESNRRMMRRIQLKITPRIVNDEFRAAKERYFNKAILGENGGIETANGGITKEKLDEAVRRLRECERGLNLHTMK